MLIAKDASIQLTFSFMQDILLVFLVLYSYILNHVDQGSQA